MGRKRKTPDIDRGPRPLADALEKILQYRSDMGTAEQVALKTGKISPQTLSNYRSGATEGKISVWSSICEVFGLRFDQFCRFAWDLQRGLPEQEALRLLFLDAPESNRYLKYKTDFDDEMEHIFANLKQWWKAEIHQQDRDRRAAEQFLVRVSGAIPEFADWYSRRDIIKNPAECRA